VVRATASEALNDAASNFGSSSSAFANSEAAPASTPRR
jgi:hypothetical protein